MTVLLIGHSLFSIVCYLCACNKTKNMDVFEGYVGIRLWDGQLVDDVIFLLLLTLFVFFAAVFRLNFQLFVKMLKDAFLVKERQNLFDDVIGKSDFFFRNFMTFQALFLLSVALVAIGRIYGIVNYVEWKSILFIIGLLFCVLFLFYLFKQVCYFLLGQVFAESRKYKLWKTSYNAIMGVWGVSLYIPVLWLVFVGSHETIPIALFFFFYILCRFVIIYKTVRIFHKKSTGFLHINLYLCAQEILPLIFLYEGIIYLYNFIETSSLWH